MEMQRAFEGHGGRRCEGVSDALMGDAELPNAVEMGV